MLYGQQLILAEITSRKKTQVMLSLDEKLLEIGFQINVIPLKSIFKRKDLNLKNWQLSDEDADNSLT